MAGLQPGEDRVEAIDLVEAGGLGVEVDEAQIAAVAEEEAAEQDEAGECRSGGAFGFGQIEDDPAGVAPAGGGEREAIGVLVGKVRCLVNDGGFQGDHGDTAPAQRRESELAAAAVQVGIVKTGPPGYVTDPVDT